MRSSAVRSLFFIAAVFMSPVAVMADGGDMGKGLPAYTADGELKPPSDFYSWVFLTSDLGMSYNESGSSSDHPPFSNVFVNPAAYRSFLKTGTWPDHTQFVKEFRNSATQGSINHHGFYQRGGRLAILVHVKDTKRFKGGWGFFAFDGKPSQPATQIPVTAECYSCHKAHGAVDTTFVQFYPEMLPVAIQHSTLSKGYLADEAKTKK
ncbi:MAG: cytochrome P460 family protein [Steroidobacteraceae bacterium]